MPSCRLCQCGFEIGSQEAELRQRLAPQISGVAYRLPEPTLCPVCRWQRRLTFRNERTMHRRRCDLTGRPMIAMYPENTPFPVYYIKDWLSDAWDATTYGRNFNFSRPFFEQFKELCDTVPHFNLFIDPDWDVNSEYTNCADGSKNCYLITQAEENEDCYYSRGMNHCTSCVDCFRLDNSELCYESINLSNCYHCFFSKDCENCADCHFSSDLRGCNNCFACHGLYKQQYCWFNEQLSKDEWIKRCSEFKFTRNSISTTWEASERIRLKVPHRYARVFQCEDTTGDHVRECRDCVEVYDSRNLEHCAYCYEIQNGAKYCLDYCMWGERAELLYECSGCGHNAYQLAFTNHCWNNISYLLYCDACFPSVSNCFGCFGLQRKEYCILNKQYTREEYAALLPRIIAHMQETGEWGEFFPPSISPHGYNETVAYDYFPVTKAEALDKGWNWFDEPENGHNATAAITPLPESIDHAPDSICSQILSCKESGKRYKIIKPELGFYRKQGLPIPEYCPELRHRKRTARRNARALWSRFCEQCGESIASTFSVDSPEIVYCERCYQARI